MDKLLELDDRRRTSFGKIGRPQDRRYLVTEEPDGTVILTPAIVVAEHEARLLARPDILAQVAADRAEPKKLRRRKPPQKSRGAGAS
jgi:hypothetical protein